MADFARRRTPGPSFCPPRNSDPHGIVRRFCRDHERRPLRLKLHHAFLLGGARGGRRPAEACIANFDRVLGRYAYAKDEERVFDPKHDDVFLYRTAQESVPLKIAAVPIAAAAKSSTRHGCRSSCAPTARWGLRPSAGSAVRSLSGSAGSAAAQVEGGPDSLHDSIKARKQR